MWKSPSIRNVADRGKIWMRKKKKWLETFLFRIDVSCTNPGRKDHVYVSKIDDERRYKQRLYLLWTLRDLLDIINRTGKVDVTDTFYQNFKKFLTFSQLYDFVKYHKEHCYNQNIPHGSCLCEICENCVLVAKGFNTRLLYPLPTNPYELIERFSWNLQEIDCIMDRCPTCCVAEIELQIQPSDSSDSPDENEDEQVVYFTWKKVDKRVTKTQSADGFIRWCSFHLKKSNQSFWMRWHYMTIGRVLFIRSTWKLLFCIFSGSWLKSSHNFIPTRSITIADYSNLVYLL